MCLDWKCLVRQLETGLIIHSIKKKVLDSKCNQYSFVIPQKAILMFHVLWTWKQVHVEDTEAENDGVFAPCCAPALKLDFHLHTVHSRPMQISQQTAIAKHERCTFSNDGKFYLDFFSFFFFFTFYCFISDRQK